MDFETIPAVLSVLASQLQADAAAGNCRPKGDHRMPPSGMGNVLRAEANAKCAVEAHAQGENGSCV